MNGQPTTHYSTNSITNHSDQSIGKFHVINVDKSTASGHDETALTCPISQPPSADEATSCPSRFQMIRVDRNFGRGRWKVNDYEPPENASSTVPVNASENDPATMANTGILNAPLPNATTSTTIPANVLPVPGVDSNGTSSAALAATAASAAAAAVTAFQQQQHRLALGNSATVLPPPNVPPQSGLLHAYPNAALANLAASNQSFLLSNHPQFGYYPFYPPPYASFAAQWAALAAANPFLGPPGLAPHQQPSSQLPTGNLGDPNRHTDTDVNGEPTVISSMPFPNLTAEHLQNAQLAAAAAPYFYAAHHPHASFVPQQSATTASYQNLTGYPGVPPPNTTIPQQHQLPPQSLPLAQYNIDVQQQQAPVLTSPKHDTSYNKNVPPPSTNVPSTTKMTTQANAFKTMATTNGTNNDLSQQMKTNPNTSTPFTDLLSSSPTISHPKSSLLSPISVTTSTNSNNNNPMGTTSLNDIWTLTTGGSPLNSAQTAAVAAMGLLNNENSKNTEIANKILEELTTPTKQNNTTDIDNKISAAMDLVKMHLLSAVREEVTELRQQIRTLNEKMSSVEQENVFLRLHVPSEVYAQYTASLSGSSSSDVNTNTAIPSLPSSSIVSSQSIQMPPLSSTVSQLPHPSSVAQPPPSSNAITSQSQQQPLPPSSTNLPPPP